MLKHSLKLLFSCLVTFFPKEPNTAHCKILDRGDRTENKSPRVFFAKPEGPVYKSENFWSREEVFYACKQIRLIFEQIYLHSSELGDRLHENLFWIYIFLKITNISGFKKVRIHALSVIILNRIHVCKNIYISEVQKMH